MRTLRGIGILLIALLVPTALAQQAAHPLFEPIADVLLGPRCLNCHTAREFPTQGEERRRHDQQVIRGADGFGAATLRCPACHQDENRAFGEVPGAPGWHLAPLSMAWESSDGIALSALEVCLRLTDTGGNGGRSVADLVTHVDEDHLVNWAFAPGNYKTGTPRPLPTSGSPAATISHSDFVALVQAWANAGGPCQ